MTIRAVLAIWNNGHDIGYIYRGRKYKLCHEGDSQVKYQKPNEVSDFFVQHKTEKNLIENYPYIEEEIIEALSENSVAILDDQGEFTDLVGNSQDTAGEQGKADPAEEKATAGSQLEYDLLPHLKDESLKTALSKLEEREVMGNTRPEPVKEDRPKLDSSSIKLIVMAVLGFALLGFLLFSMNRREIIFGRLDPGSIDPNAGYKAISYDVKEEKYTEEFLPKENIAKTKKSCGYIVKYEFSQETIKGEYTVAYSALKATVYQQVIKVEIYDIHTGKSIAKQTFKGELKSVLKGDYAAVDESLVENWVKKYIKEK